MIFAEPSFYQVSDALIGIIIGATVIHELIGPVVSKAALQKAGETRVKGSEEV